jgi:hypothetical protein
MSMNNGWFQGWSSTSRNATPASSQVGSATATTAATAASLFTTQAVGNGSVFRLAVTAHQRELAAAGVANDDELALKLLTQFPVYGSHVASAGGGSVVAQAHSPDWLNLGGYSNTSPTNNDNHSQLTANYELDDSEALPQPARMESASPNRGAISTTTNNAGAGAGGPQSQQQQKQQQQRQDSVTATQDWDADEQSLWKTIGSGGVSTALRPTTTNTSSSSSNGKTLGSTPPVASERRQEWVYGNSSSRSQTEETKDTEHAVRHNATTASTSFLTDTPAATDTSTASRRYFSTTSFSTLRQPHTANRAQDGETKYEGTTSSDDDHDALALASNATDKDRQHWMPDQLCKQCYSCDTQFTVFRRRHHCRLCGQVFCNNCSAYFVSVTKRSVLSTMRVCKMCNEQVAQKGGLVEMDPSVATMVVINPNANMDTDADAAVNNSSSALSPDGRHGRVPSSTSVGDLQQGAAAAPLHTMVDAFESPQSNGRKTASDQLQGGDGTVAGTADSILHSLSSKRLFLHQQQQQQQSIIAAAVATSESMQDWEEREKQAAGRLLTHLASDHSDDHVNAKAKPLISMPLLKRDSSVGSKSGVAVAVPVPNNNANKDLEAVREGRRHLGLTAASHLEHLAEKLLRIHAPLLWGDLARNHAVDNGKRVKSQWINRLLTLATRACATVDPNVKKGDLLDIRPYCKVKVIPGGSYEDCAYMSGVFFRKSVSHKRMAREIENPRIMLLSGGIEFTRTENRIASLETLFEQEEKYMEILVGKILKLKPDVLIVGRSVSRRAQELLLKADVVLIQRVKTTLLNRISRQTGATVISSTDHVMNQFGAKVLGKCHRFRLAAFRDNEVWVDHLIDSDSSAVVVKKKTTGVFVSDGVEAQRSIQALLANPELSNHERQAALAAYKLGEAVLDGSEAVKSGLAKRGVAQTYVMLEGCPKHLGCSVVLRGANRVTLKEVKTVFRFLVNMAYNLRLETSYLKERSARLRPDYEIIPQHTFSSSLCVNYGNAPAGRIVRPWNGSDPTPSPEGVEINAFDHQAILITSVWMTDKTQCCPAEVKGICYYSLQDVALGQFLRDSCFNLSLKCQNPNCKKSVLDHSLSFIHNDGLINIMVEELDEPLPASPLEVRGGHDDGTQSDEEEETDKPIATWTYCKHCGKVVTPLVFISENTWKFSFGKFLEVFFYNRDAILNAPGHQCRCQLQNDSTLYFGCGKLAARFTYERVQPFNVFVRRNLPLDVSFHKSETLRRLDVISMSSSDLFVKFDKHIGRISRDARSLFHSAVNRPEHLQTVLSELNRIGSEVDHAAKTLQEKIASVSDKCRRKDDGMADEALLRFPWFARRYLFMLASAWNEKLSAAGQAITAMKKLAASTSQNADGGIGPNVSAVVGDPHADELLEGMKRLRQLNEHYARYNVTDITQVLPSLPGSANVQQDGEDDDDFEDQDSSLDFGRGVDADVLASRRRLQNSGSSVNSRADRTPQSSRSKPTKSLGTRRSVAEGRSQDSSISQQPKVTPGGAVKSAINRFFNRGGREYDDLYVVDLGIFAEGRPRLAPGVDGIVVPVMDEQWSTIIAYSLSSNEYEKQFQQYMKIQPMELPDIDMPSPSVDRSGAAKWKGSGSSDTGGNETSTKSSDKSPPPPQAAAEASRRSAEKKYIERQMLVRNKSHIKHTFRDLDEKGQPSCKFVCTTYWATQFQAVRRVFLSENGSTPSSLDAEESFVESLSSAYSWEASGGKSGASFARTSDDRFVIKCISRTELQMFLDCAPAYFEYLSKAFFHGL